MKKLITLIGLLVLLVTSAQAPLLADDDWSDLREEERAVFGSEKEEKYPINAFLVEKEEWEDHHSLMILWAFKKTDYPRYRSLRVLPFWYSLNSKVDARKKYFIPLLLHYHRTDGISHMTANPLYYRDYSPHEQDTSITYLFWWGREQGNTYTDSYFFSPFFYINSYTWNDPERNSRGSEHISVSPLHYLASKSDEKGKAERRNWWFPIIPLTYHNWNSEGGHRNYLGLLDYSWRNTDEGSELKRFWLAPFLFWQGADNSFTYLFTPIYARTKTTGSEPLNENQAAPGESTWWAPIIPLIYHHSGSEGQSHTNLLWLFDWASTSEGLNRTWVMPFLFWKQDAYTIIPPFYFNLHAGKSKQDGASHHNALLLFNWGYNEEGSLSKFWFIPFVFHQPGESGYRYYVPFYCRPPGNTHQAGTSFGLFHYHSWQPGKETRWYGYLHYYNRDIAEKKKTNIWFLLYTSLKREDYSLKVVLPLYFTYTSAEKSLSVNILGLSRSIAAGPNPQIGVGAGKSEHGWYVDTDVSWLYDVVSVASRITVSSSEEALDTVGAHPDTSISEMITDGTANDTARAEDAEDTGVSLHGGIATPRENTRTFWGLHLLFGLTAVELADDTRHVRVLPLSWITWDKSSDNRVTWLLNYLHYKQEETEYLVFFPFYGMQREGSSFRKGYLLNAYWDEYDAHTDLRERTVLWPLVNWYRSPDKSGWRVFPLIWHKKWKDDNGSHMQTISPLYYGKRDRIADTGMKAFSISPLHVNYRYSRQGDGGRISMYPLVPLYYSSRHESETGTSKSVDTAKAIVPLYYKSTYQFTGDDGSAITSSTMVGLPLFYYHYNDTTSQVSGNDTVSTPAHQRQRTFFLLGVYDHVSPGYHHFNILGGLYSRTSSHQQNTETWNGLYWLASHRTSERNIQHFSRDRMGRQMAPVSMDTRRATTWLFPIIYTTATQSLEGQPRFRESHTITPLWYRSSRKYGEWNENQRHTTFWAPVVPLCYYHGEPGSSHLNLFWLFDWKSESYGGYSRTRFWAFPLYRYERDGTEQSTFVFPLFYYKKNQNFSGFLAMLFWSSYQQDTRDRQLHLFPLFMYRHIPGQTDLFAAGLYLHNSKNYRRQNFLFLADHRRWDNRDEDRYNLLLGSVHYGISPEVQKIRLAWGLLAGYERNRQSGDYTVDIAKILYGISREDGNFTHYLTPLYYYSRETDDETLLVLPPALSLFWSTGDESEKLQAIGLGALWYRNLDRDMHEERQMLLLGTLWNKVERPQRGYTSIGSFWGLLWEYETEEDTGFKKFSLLKFLFKRVETPGETYYKVLGVKI